MLADHGRRDSTVTTYRKALDWCDRNLAGIGRKVGPDIGEEDILHLARLRTVKESTVRYHVNVLNAYVKWATGRDILPGLMLQWNRPTPKRHFITREEFRRMYGIADPTGRMILMLGAYMGLRRSEIVGIDLDDIGTDTITVHGKGHGSAGFVTDQYMPPSVRAEVDAYLSWRARYVGKDRREMLIAVRDGHASPTRINGDTVNETVRRLAHAIGTKATAHSLRRLYCTSLYNHGRGADGKGADLGAIRHLTRHASVDILFKCYIEPDPESARSCADALDMFRSLVNL